MWTFRTIILPVTLADTARNLCMALTGSASEGMFTTPLYTGETVTHTISSGYIATEFAEVLPCGGEGGDVQRLAEMLSGVEVEMDAEDIGEILEMVDISEEEPYVAMARLGLVLGPDTNEYESQLDLPISDER